jgi:hypothetical protein
MRERKQYEKLPEKVSKNKKKIHPRLFFTILFSRFQNVLKFTKGRLWRCSSNEELCGQTEESTPAQ